MAGNLIAAQRQCGEGDACASRDSTDYRAQLFDADGAPLGVVSATYRGESGLSLDFSTDESGRFCLRMPTEESTPTIEADAGALIELSRRGRVQLESDTGVPPMGSFEISEPARCLVAEPAPWHAYEELERSWPFLLLVGLSGLGALALVAASVTRWGRLSRLGWLLAGLALVLTVAFWTFAAPPPGSRLGTEEIPNPAAESGSVQREEHSASI